MLAIRHLNPCLTDRKVVPKTVISIVHYILSYVFKSKAERTDFADIFMSVQCMKRLTAVINIDITVKSLIILQKKREFTSVHYFLCRIYIKYIRKKLQIFANTDHISVIKVSSWCLRPFLCWKRFWKDLYANTFNNLLHKSEPCAWFQSIMV